MSWEFPLTRGGFTHGTIFLADRLLPLKYLGLALRALVFFSLLVQKMAGDSALKPLVVQQTIDTAILNFRGAFSYICFMSVDPASSQEHTMYGNPQRRASEGVGENSAGKEGAG